MASHLTLVAFKGSRYGWAGSARKAGPIVHTTDGGRHWTVQLSAGRVSGLSFADRHDGWAITGGKAYHTTDGGGAWQLQTNAPDSTWVDALTAGDAFIGAPAGFTTGGLSGTTDGGATWQPSVSAAGGYYGDLSALQFSRRYEHGWAVAAAARSSPPADGGATWAAQSSNTDRGPERCALRRRRRTAGRSATRARSCNTTDGGATWAAQSSGTSYELTGVTFTDAQNGWATGQSFDLTTDYSSGLILHTTDGGQHWTTQYDSPYDPTTLTPGIAFSAVAFADAQRRLGGR